MTDSLSIPAFLRRPQTNGDSMQHDPVMKPMRKPREKVELPLQIAVGDEDLIIADLSRSEILHYIEQWEKLLANAPKIELELRALRVEMKRKLK
jgi:hypothetical protein